MTSPLFNLVHIDQASIAYLQHNEAVNDLEAVGAGVVLDRTLTAPPGSPNDGDIYIPLATATGAWTGLEDLLVQWRNNVWKVITPFTNFVIYSQGDTDFIQWDGAAWNPLSVGGVGTLLNRETLSGTKTLVNGDDEVQALNPNGAARDVVLPSSPTDDKKFTIINDSDGLSASGNTLNIKETGAGPVVLTLDDTTGQMNTNCMYDLGSTTWVFWS